MSRVKSPNEDTGSDAKNSPNNEHIGEYEGWAVGLPSRPLHGPWYPTTIYRSFFFFLTGVGSIEGRVRCLVSCNTSDDAREAFVL